MPGDGKKSDDYLQERRIPELFQSLTIALLYNKPENHIDYLLGCLDQIQTKQDDKRVAWDAFLPAERPLPSNGTPLPNVHGVLRSGTRQ